MGNRVLCQFAIAVGIAILCSPARAQVPSVYGSLSVTVLDQSGAVVPGATVEIRQMERNWEHTAASDARGHTFFVNLQPGTYTVSVSAPGLTPQATKLAVLLGHQASLRFELSPETRHEEVTVTAPSVGPLDSATIPVHTHVGSAEVLGLPVNQRSYLDLSLLDSSLQRDTLRVHAVAVTSGFNVMGQRPRNNSIQLDGADLNDETTGGARGSVSMEAVQEFQILSSGYQAEYGRASGGVVNAITKSGTNEFGASLFGFLRHRTMDATNAMSPIADPPYTRTQYGASLSGPLRRDRTFFFLSLEQLRRQESGFSRVGGNPADFSLTQAQEQLKASDPTNPAVVEPERGVAIARTGIDPTAGAPPEYGITPLGQSGGVYPVSQRLGEYSARLDHELAPAHRFAARFNYSHDRQSGLEAQNNDQIAGLLSYGRTASLTTIDPTVVLSLSSTVGADKVNEARFSWAGRQFEMMPNSIDTPVNIPGSAFLGREPILPHVRTENHWHIQDTMMWSRGPHLLKLGGDLMACPAEVDYHREVNGVFSFGPVAAPGAAAAAPLLTPVQAYGLGLPAQFVQQFGDPLADAGKTSVGVFAQDSWRVTSRLTVDFGLRYDVEAAEYLEPSDPMLRPWFEALKIERRPPVDHNNLQPRIGFSYQALDSGEITVSGSYGIFYDRLLNLATYLATVGDGGQMTRTILSGLAAVGVFRSAEQKLDYSPGTDSPTGLLAFSSAWDIGKTQQGNFVISIVPKRDLLLDLGCVWVRGTQLPRSRDYNSPDPDLDFTRPVSAVSEVMVFEDSASSTYHGLRVNLRGRLSSSWMVNASYTFSKAIDDAEEIFPHTRNQNMFNFRSDRGLALYDQRQRFVLSSLYEPGSPWRKGSTANRVFGNWIVSPIVEVSSGRPVNVLLGFDNNRDGFPGSDRPDLVPAGTPGSVTTRWGTFSLPPSGMSGNLGRNAFVGSGFVSVSLRLQRNVSLTERMRAELIAEAFNAFNRTNVRTVNPNYKHAGELLTAHDARQVQLGIRLRF